MHGHSKTAVLLDWVNNHTMLHGIVVSDFSKSFSDGRALIALLHDYLPREIPASALACTDARKNFTLAFDVRV